MKARILLALIAVAIVLIAFPFVSAAAGSDDPALATTADGKPAPAGKPTATATKTPRPTKTPTPPPTPTPTPWPTNTPSSTPPPGSSLIAKQNVLNFINSIKGKQILSGQQEAEWVDDLSQDLNFITSTTGKSPAIRGFESQLTTDTTVAENPTSVSIASWHNFGFIPEWSWHMGAPLTEETAIVDDDYNHSKLTTDIARTLTTTVPFTPEHASFIKKLDVQAARLQILEDYGVPVLWRPFHEMNGNWFWWSKGGPEQYKQLWIYMYDYFTKTKGLDNLIWVWSTIKGPEYGEGNPPGKEFYPGDAYVDITGGDMYSGSNPFDWPLFTDAYTGFMSLAPNNATAMTEGAAIPDPQQLFETHHLSYVWFLPWYGDYVKKNNTADYLRYVYNSAYTITVDELPDLKGTPTTP